MTPALLLLLALSAQAEPPAVPAPVDRDIDLDIAERQWVETEFHAALALEVSPREERGVALLAGVSLHALRFEARLRNVRGRVRFRSNLGPLSSMLARRSASP